MRSIAVGTAKRVLTDSALFNHLLPVTQFMMFERLRVASYEATLLAFMRVVGAMDELVLLRVLL